MNVPNRASRSDKTRAQVLDAAADLLGRRPDATLADVATAAGVGRTTVHRHFATREDLQRALAFDALERLGTSIDGSRLDDGTAPEVLTRVITALAPLSDRFRFLGSIQASWDDPELVAAWFGLSHKLEQVVDRGRCEGHLRIDVPTVLVVEGMVGVLWSAFDAVRDGRLAPADVVPGVCALVLDGVRSRGTAS